MSPVNFIIITGTSGSGKTIALQVLEDLGYYCIDNLPASLLPELLNGAERDGRDNYAVSIDSRNQDSIADLGTLLDDPAKQGVDLRVIFIDAEDAALLRRYSETRRKHPLTDKNTSLAEAIVRERNLLEPLAAAADYRCNTSKTTPHELRSLIRNYAATSSGATMTLLFRSFGFKYGNPRDADFVFDVRCLPNPHWHTELRPLTGLDEEVKQFLSDEPMVEQMYQHLRDFVEHWLPCFVNDNRTYMTVAIGCTGGQHRSVYLCRRLSNHFANNDLIQTQVRHRELNL